jgi:hypothetical protein
MECFHSRHHNEACLAINPPAVEEGSSLFNWHLSLWEGNK